MIRIGICSETAAFGDLLKRNIEEWGKRQRTNLQIKLFVTGEEILADIEQTGYFDILLMDTRLNGSISGIDTAWKVRQIYESFCLIFMFGKEKMYKEVMKLQPFRCLDKPIRKADLFEGLTQAADRYRLLQEIFVFRFKGITYCIRLREVLYFTSDRRVIRIYMENGREYVFYEKLDELEKKLQNSTAEFFRVHQSYLINVRQVEQYHYRFVIMRNKETIPISPDRRDIIKKKESKNDIYRG